MLCTPPDAARCDTSGREIAPAGRVPDRRRSIVKTLLAGGNHLAYFRNSTMFSRIRAACGQSGW